MTILDKIIAYKRIEIAERREKISLAQLEKSLLFERPRKSLVAELKNASKIGIIAEFKRRSPSKGMLNETAQIGQVTRDYCDAGASGISVLTDEKFFGGSLYDLEMAFYQTKCPLLRKDFILDEYQIVEARAFGASAILLIASYLADEQIKKLSRFAVSLDLEVLFEVHTIAEIPAEMSNIAMIGVNNRDLRDFSIDINRSIEVAERLPAEITKISESGLSQPETILQLKQSGFDGFLIGESFMRASDPAAACNVFIEQVKTIMGKEKQTDFEQA